MPHHPSYIHEKDGGKYKHFGLTHKDKPVDGIKPERLDRNPNPRDKKPAYFIPVEKVDNKKHFKKDAKFQYDDWKMSSADKEKINKYKKKEPPGS
jgi:hypothetical protein